MTHSISSHGIGVPPDNTKLTKGHCNGKIFHEGVMAAPRLVGHHNRRGSGWYDQFQAWPVICWHGQSQVWPVILSTPGHRYYNKNTDMTGQKSDHIVMHNIQSKVRTEPRTIQANSEATALEQKRAHVLARTRHSQSRYLVEPLWTEKPHIIHQYCRETAMRWIKGSQT